MRKMGKKIKQEIEAIQDLVELQIYYRKNRSKVKDLTSFKNVIREKMKELSDLVLVTAETCQVLFLFFFSDEKLRMY